MTRTTTDAMGLVCSRMYSGQGGISAALGRIASGVNAPATAATSGNADSIGTYEPQLLEAQRQGSVTFDHEQNYLQALVDSPLERALKSVASLCEDHGDAGGQALKLVRDALINRTTNSNEEERGTLNTLHDAGALKRINVVVALEIPSDLTDAERGTVAQFFADRMEAKREPLQTAFNTAKAQNADIKDVFTIKSFPKSSHAKDNARKIIHTSLTRGITNKRRISYLLATANGESRLVPVMEGTSNITSPDIYKYEEFRARYYYSTKGGKQSYNTGSHTQVRLSEYLIDKCKSSNYIVVSNASERQFTKGSAIDQDNFALLNTLLTSTMSKKKSGVWVDKDLDEANTTTLFTDMTAIKTSQGEAGTRVITDTMLKNADFYRFAGKGMVQTTWKDNYKKVTTDIKSAIPSFAIDLEANPEKMLEGDTSVYALVIGLEKGTYHPQDKGISEFLSTGTDAQWDAARYMVNLEDKMESFSACGKVYHSIVFKGDWLD